MLSLKTPEKENGFPLPVPDKSGLDGAGLRQGAPGWEAVSASLGSLASSPGPQLAPPRGKLAAGHSTHIHWGPPCARNCQALE